MTTTCATEITIKGTVTSVYQDITPSGAYLTVYVNSRPVSMVLTGDMPVPRRGQQVVITGFHVIGDPDINVADAVITVTGPGACCVQCGAVA